MTDVPHFSLPFRFERGAATVVEQDTTDDVATCCVSILLCPVGFRSELPGFGVVDPTFSMGDVDIDALLDAIALWEPRADVWFDSDPDALDELVEHVTASIRAPSTD